MSFKAALAAVALATAVASAYADTLTLDTANSSGGIYRYNFNQTNSPNGSEFFYGGSVFTISGLSGVTGATGPNASQYSVSLTATSAQFTLSYGTQFNPGTYADLLTVTSSVMTTGIAQFSIATAFSNANGTVQGPAAAAMAVTPEPSSLLLLATGVLGAVCAVRRRFV